MFERYRCIAEFFGNSAKRSDIFAAILANSEIPKNKQKKLINICRTTITHKIFDANSSFHVQ